MIFEESLSYSKLAQNNDKRNTILKAINFFPGIRYNDLIRATNLTNGTLSHHLTTLEKRSVIKIIRIKNSNITRYYPASTPSEEILILGYLKIKTTSEILLLLSENKYCTFVQIVSSIQKAPSTISWNLKRLMDAEIIRRKKGDEVSEYSLKNPDLIKKLIEQNNTTLLDRCVDNYTSLIDELG
jgi:predicted transcriptional regulator